MYDSKQGVTTLFLAFLTFSFLPLSTYAAAIEDILVTAHRIAGPSQILPVQTVDLRKPSPATDIVGADVLRQFPSLAISQSGSLGSVTQIRARGSEANHMLVLFDGVEANDPATGSEYNFANLSLTGTEFIEYLPGPQSAIWGSDAVAGVLNSSTIPTVQRRRVTLAGGNFSTRQAQLQLADRQEDYFYNVAIGQFDTDGTNTARSGSEEDGFESLSVLAHGGVSLRRTNLSVMVRTTSTTSEFDPAPFPAFIPVDGNSESDHDSTLAKLAASWMLLGQTQNWSMHSDLSYLSTKNRSRNDGIRTSDTAGERLKLSNTLRYQTDSAKRLDVLLEYEQEDFKQSGIASFFGDPNQDQQVENTSIGVEYSTNFTDKLNLAVSGRFDRNSDFDDAASFRLIGRYALRPNTDLWINLGTGIKNPTFTERFGFTPDTFFGNDTLEPEENRGLSAGISHHGNFWSASLNLFKDKLTNEINGFSFDAATGGFTAVNEDSDSERQGAEFQLQAYWQQTQLAFGAAYLDAEDAHGVDEIRRPNLQVFASANYVTGKWRFDLNANYTASQDDLDFGSFPANQVELDAYTLVGTGVSYRYNDWLSLSLAGSNILDEDYENLFGYQSPGRSGKFSLTINW